MTGEIELNQTGYTKLAADFRQIARKALNGKWGVAVLAGFLASILGVFDFNVPEIDVEAMLRFDLLNNDLLGLLIKVGQILTVIAAIRFLLYVVFGSLVGNGYAKFNIDLINGEQPKVNTLWSYTPYWKNMIVVRILRELIVFLFTLLFIIPGIIASYSYAMVPYIMAENPEMNARDALARSKQIMEGNRWRLFCLQFSFIGWNILSSLTLGIGYLWLTPYTSAAEAAFYNDITAEERMKTETASEEETYTNG